MRNNIDDLLIKELDDAEVHTAIVLHVAHTVWSPRQGQQRGNTVAEDEELGEDQGLPVRPLPA